ncbi:hypothetical protein PR048_029598 [Dryococelus australis]|uniref:Reelin domain-containing protein n=1 Tax=Dryococelus australis TaxID=614101 RepID=A0ABQ9GDV5_9NEOP|nr:hypothetical protein PR048_029598 [Dryococelus australis]
MEQRGNAKVGGNGISLRKSAYQRHRPARFPLAEIRERPERQDSPVVVDGCVWAGCSGGRRPTELTWREVQIVGTGGAIRAAPRVLAGEWSTTCHPGESLQRERYNVRPQGVVVGVRGAGHHDARVSLPRRRAHRRVREASQERASPRPGQQETRRTALLGHSHHRHLHSRLAGRRYVTRRGRWVSVIRNIRLQEPMSVIESNMERRRNEGAGGNGRSVRKPAGQHGIRPARFPLAKIRTNRTMVSENKDTNENVIAVVGIWATHFNLIFNGKKICTILKELGGRKNGRSSRKPSDQRHGPVRFSHSKIPVRPLCEWNPDMRLIQYQLRSPLVDDRPIMNAIKYRVVSGVVWTNRTMVNSNTDTYRTGVLAVVDIGDSHFVRAHPGWLSANRKPLTRGWPNHAQPSKKVVITSLDGTPFRGFFMQARDAATDEWLGEWETAENTNGLPECSSITHADNKDKLQATLIWTAPRDKGSGRVYFTVTAPSVRLTGACLRLVEGYSEEMGLGLSPEHLQGWGKFAERISSVCSCEGTKGGCEGVVMGRPAQKEPCQRKGQTTCLPPPDSIPRGVTPRFPHVWNPCHMMPLVGGVFSYVSHFYRPSIPALLHTHLASPSPVLETSMLRAAQVSSLHSNTLHEGTCGLLDRVYECSSCDGMVSIISQTELVLDIHLLYRDLPRPQRPMSRDRKNFVSSMTCRLDSTDMCMLEPHMFVHWLLSHRVASVTSHLAVWDSLLVSLQVCYWIRVVQGVSNKLRSNCKVNFSVHVFDAYLVLK